MFTRLRSTSRATCACSSAALAITRLRSLICATAPAMVSSAMPAPRAMFRVDSARSVLVRIDSTASSVPPWILPIIRSISLVDCWVR
ncbi:hypothetical protein D3C79_812870 [compost metagenome]